MRWVLLACLVACHAPGAQLGAACKTNADCDSKLACLADKCTTLTCTTSTDCAAGFSCTPTHQCQADATGPSNNMMMTGDAATVTVLSHPFAREAKGAVVIINGAAASTADDGTATLPVVAKPYDLTVLLPAQTFPNDPSFHRPPVIMLITGLTRLDPVVRFYEGSPVVHDTVTGHLTYGPGIPSGVGLYWFDAAGAYEWGREPYMSTSGAQPYSAQVYRHGSVEAPSGQLQVLVRDDGPTANTSYFYGAAPLALMSTPGMQTKDIAVTPVATTQTINVSVTLPGVDWTVEQTTWFGIFAGRRVEGKRVDSPGANFSYQLPVQTGFSKELEVAVRRLTGGERRAVHSVVVDGMNPALSVSFIAPPTLTAPAADAAVGVGTQFSWSAPANATNVMIAKLGNGPEFQCITRGSSCSLPDTANYGASWLLPKGATGSWQVTSTVPFMGDAPSTDLITNPGNLETNDTLSDGFLFDSVRDADAASTARRPFTL